jgi:hypothetical protein
MFVSEKFCAVKKEQLTTESKPLLTMYLANPRGFCAGVDRAVKIVEAALEVYGAPVYVRHEIVHNAWVVDSQLTKCTNNLWMPLMPYENNVTPLLIMMPRFHMNLGDQRTCRINTYDVSFFYFPKDVTRSAMSRYNNRPVICYSNNSFR